MLFYIICLALSFCGSMSSYWCSNDPSYHGWFTCWSRQYDFNLVHLPTPEKWLFLNRKRKRPQAGFDPGTPTMNFRMIIGSRPLGYDQYNNTISWWECLLLKTFKWMTKKTKKRERKRQKKRKKREKRERERETASN